MLFSSAFFIAGFLPAFLIIYALVPKKWKNLWVLIGSFCFYAWGAPAFAFIVLISGSFDYWIAHQFDRANRKTWLMLGLSVNVLTLFVFKYFNFFTENVRAAVEATGMNYPEYADIALPLGISFFTFQKISYLIDVYRKDTKPALAWLDYLMFVFLFPQLIAGPIIRYKDINSQIRNRFEQSNWEDRLHGFFRFVIGLSKKVLIADILAPVADAAFADPTQSSAQLLVGLLAYTFQIYFDFSGYSDMAIGLGKMMGFQFPENFHWPYIARGFKAFWSKWHITLSTWMRDYLYFPLGGSRLGLTRTIINLWIVFLLSGLWHGAGWNFIVWGAWHGLFLSIERFIPKKAIEDYPWSAPITFVFVCLGWVWFRAPNLNDAVVYYDHLFAWSAWDSIELTYRQTYMLFVAGMFAFIPVIFQDFFSSFLKSSRSSVGVSIKIILILALLLLSLGQIAISDSQPFIYFRF